MKEFIGIDLGGSKIIGLRVNENFEIVKKVHIKKYDSALMEKIIQTLQDVVKSLDTPNVVGIGLGLLALSIVGMESYTVSPNIKALKEVNFKKIFEEKFKKVVFV